MAAADLKQATDGDAGDGVGGRWRLRGRRRGRPEPTAAAVPRVATPPELALDVTPHDPLIAFCQQAGGAVDVDELEL
ncbi:MAG: hypothetical protein LH469_10005, partial [Frankiaceae bacterium]|nr:hypothetical protein [Frankiaceae bacterium]